MAAILLIPIDVLAAPADDARKVVENMINSALAVLRDPAVKANRDARTSKLRAVANQAFDWKGMARGSLGPYWRDLTPEQQAEFVRVFEALLANQYMDDLDRFQGTEQVKIVSSAAKDDLVFVKTLLITASNESVPMDYTLQQVGGVWMIEDLSIENVSMVGHYRDSFKRFLVNKSFAELLAILKRKLGS